MAAISRDAQEKSIRAGKKRLEQAKKRLSDLDLIISRLYEGHVLGSLSMERYQKMDDNVDAFIALTEMYVDVTELTPTIVNEYIKKIIVYERPANSRKTA